MWKAFGIAFLLTLGWLNADTDHWAFAPVKVETSGPNSIDRFVGDRLVEKGLEWSPQEARSTLLRRLYLVMLGVPPSVETMEAFLDDEAPTNIA